MYLAKVFGMENGRKIVISYIYVDIFSDNLLQSSQNEAYKRMWHYMSANPSVMPKSNPEGVHRVVTSNGGRGRGR
jgi:hypothetical protein